MKAKILSIVLLLSFSAVLMAQTNENGPKKQMRGQDRPLLMHRGQMGPGAGLNLTDAQKEAFKQSMIALHKQMVPLKNELGEAEAHQKTLVSAEKPDLGAINKNIEKIGSIRVEMAKLMMKNRLDMRAQLTDEQRLKFDMMKGKMKHGEGAKRGRGPGQWKGSKGMGSNMPMYREHAMN